MIPLHDHGGTLVVRTELARRDEADRVGDALAERAVSDDHTRKPLRGRDEVEDPLLLGQPAGEERMRRIVGVADPRRNGDAARNDAYVPRAELPRSCGERIRRAHDDARAPQIIKTVYGQGYLIGVPVEREAE